MFRWIFRLLSSKQPPPSSLDEIETRARIEKLTLEQQKLALERQLLTRELAWQGRLINWLKALAVPVTFSGAALAYIIGSGQLRQSEQNRVADRFDKTLARVASDKTTERVTGISGLRLFLQERSAPEIQTATLQYLVNAISVEKDPLVRGAILDTFDSIRKSDVPLTAIDGALRTAVERNRNLAASVYQQWRVRIEGSQKQRIAQVVSLHLKPEQIPSPIPEALLAKLNFADFVGVLDSERGPFQDLPPEDIVPLEGLARTISKLVQLGGTHHDFSRIYCEKCDFAGVASLSQSKFDRAYLGGADFSHSVLRGASFKDADIGGAFFYGSDLKNANLTTRFHRDYGFRGLVAFTPYLDCANLDGADLSGITVAVLLREFSPTWSGGHALETRVPKIGAAVISATTKMEDAIVIVITEVSDSYATKHPKDEVVLAIRDDMPENPLLANLWSHGERFRRHGFFASDEANYTRTGVIQSAKIKIGGGAELQQWAKAALKGLIDQPNWKKIKLMADLAQGVSSAPVSGRVSQASRKLLQRPCAETGHPSEFQLTIESGTNASPAVMDN